MQSAAGKSIEVELGSVEELTAILVSASPDILAIGKGLMSSMPALPLKINGVYFCFTFCIIPCLIISV